jgi:hypothetical protein
MLQLVKQKQETNNQNKQKTNKQIQNKQTNKQAQ